MTYITEPDRIYATDFTRARDTTPRSYCDAMTYTDIYPSPLGAIVMVNDGNALTGLRFIDNEQAIVSSDALPLQAETIFRQTRQWLDEYFHGKHPPFPTPSLRPQGTDFQCRIWQALMEIPYGKTVSYGELAKRIGCLSAQAVGQAVRRNPIALLIPCHRVVGANGDLTGYAYGIERKRYLLELENPTAYTKL